MTSVLLVYGELLDILETGLPIEVPGSDIQVTMVGQTTLKPEVVMIGRIEGTRSAGTQNRIRSTTRNLPFDTSQDEYTVQLFISVSWPGGEIMDVATRADQIWEACRTIIERDFSVGGVYEALPTGDFTFEPEADANVRVVTVGWGVDITARD